jgi:chromosomal replication initiation ATPase DnaA
LKALKIVTNRIPLASIVPAMLIEIVQEHISKYVKAHDIAKFKVEFGYIEESVSISVHEDVIEQSERSFLMTYQAKVIEIFLLDHFKVKKEDIYMRIRNREIVRIRQVIHFFMAYYADMNLETIGFITGKFDHATVLNSKKQVLKRLQKFYKFRKDIFYLDAAIYMKLGTGKSLIFDSDSNILGVT